MGKPISTIWHEQVENPVATGLAIPCNALISWGGILAKSRKRSQIAHSCTHARGGAGAGTGLGWAPNQGHRRFQSSSLLSSWMLFLVLPCAELHGQCTDFVSHLTL